MSASPALAPVVPAARLHPGARLLPQPLPPGVLEPARACRTSGFAYAIEPALRALYPDPARREEALRAPPRASSTATPTWPRPSSAAPSTTRSGWRPAWSRPRRRSPTSDAAGAAGGDRRRLLLDRAAPVLRGAGRRWARWCSGCRRCGGGASSTTPSTSRLRVALFRAGYRRGDALVAAHRPALPAGGGRPAPGRRGGAGRRWPPASIVLRGTRRAGRWPAWRPRWWRWWATPPWCAGHAPLRRRSTWRPPPAAAAAARPRPPPREPLADASPGPHLRHRQRPRAPRPCRGAAGADGEPVPLRGAGREGGHGGEREEHHGRADPGRGQGVADHRLRRGGRRRRWP